MFTPHFTLKPDKFASLPISLESANSSLVSVLGDSYKGLSSGTTTVTASTEYDETEFSADQTVEVKNVQYTLSSTRQSSQIVIARKTNEIEVGEEYVVQAYILSPVTAQHPYTYGYSDDNLVIWESSAPSVCRVKNGVLFGESAGTATITAYNLTKTVSESCQVSVVAVPSIQYDVITLASSDIDTTDTETTSLDLKDIIENTTSSSTYKKIVFPENQVYYISPEYLGGGIYVPNHTVVDFNGSVIQIEESSMTTTGYQIFIIKDCERSEVQNAVIYGERFLLETPGNYYGCIGATVTGDSVRSGFRNCTISNSPGFNASFGNTAFASQAIKLAGLESGWIDDYGNDATPDSSVSAYAFRSAMTGSYSYDSSTGWTAPLVLPSTIGDMIGVGNVQGYGGYLYMSARVYDIFFYDSNKTFISCQRNCIQYYRYPKPANAKYCRICFYASEMPSSQGERGIAQIYSYDMPERCFFKDCKFENNYATALTANGGESSTIDGCYFKDNGYIDPAAHIDWEDGRQRNKGHILKNCTFSGGGPVRVLGSDGLSAHNNTFVNCRIANGDEAQFSRIWLNQFVGNKTTTIATKTDMVFSQNFGVSGAQYSITNQQNVNFAVRAAENSFDGNA